MNRTTASTLVLLLVAACSGDSEATTTTLAGTSSTASSTTAATTSSPTVTGGGQTGSTLPPVVAQAVFAFTAGTTPFITVTVEVGETADGPWMPAGFNADPTPTLTGSSFWVRFNIANQDSLGEVVDVDISGFDNSVIGEDVCALQEPIPVGGSTTCVVGDFPAQEGGAQNNFSSSGTGERQGTELERYFQPPIPQALEFAGARHSFVLVFDIGEGVRVDGTSDGAEVSVGTDGVQLSGPVRVDCSDSFPNGRSSTGGSPDESEPALIAFVIENFDGGGGRQGGCVQIPKVSLPFESIRSDEAFLYQTGSESSATTAPATPTSLVEGTTTTMP